MFVNDHKEFLEICVVHICTQMHVVTSLSIDCPDAFIDNFPLGKNPDLKLIL